MKIRSTTVLCVRRGNQVILDFLFQNNVLFEEKIQHILYNIDN